MEVDFQSGELDAISEHKYYLSQEHGRDVGFEAAKEDWLLHQARRWRREREESRMRQMLDMQRQEINRHKWIESEKAQRDLGAEAVFDWINRYAAQWREWYEREYCRNEA